MERFAFELAHRERAVTLIVREGFVSEEFIDLARTEPRSEAQERRLDRLKLEMAERVLGAPAEAVYDLASPVSEREPPGSRR